jgi:hypothetical protein
MGYIQPDLATVTCRMRSARHLPLVVLAVLTAALVLAIVTPAAAVPAVGCGPITVNHKRYQVRAHVLNCKLAVRWSTGFLAHGTVPAGYNCQRYSPKVTRVRFLCFDPATSTRTDGPRSFSATA